MELALYCPLCGFYEKKRDTTGQRGDFYTSVSVGPLFGELLAFQFAEWLMELRIPGCRLQIVEGGAHDGQLAKDILNWLRLRRPRLFEEIEYRIVEPSTTRQQWQRETLSEFAPRVRWLADLYALAGSSSSAPLNRQLEIGNQQSSGVCGIIFANELLDAMPVHRLGWDAKRREWFEWGVTTANERFVWQRLPVSGARGMICVPPELLGVLPDGFTTEICPAAEDWWRTAASVLTQGRLLTIDYGLDGEERFAPQRANGTLRAYHRHRLADDVLANPGEQDLTSHVDFTVIQQAGETAGLKTEALAPQAKFLTGIARRAWQDGGDFGPWTSGQTRQFQTLTHPDHLGRSFRVLIQSTASPHHAATG